MPDYLDAKPCGACEGSGTSPHARRLQDRWYGNVGFHPSETGSPLLTTDTPEVRAFAERNIGHAPDFYGDGEQAIVREATRLATMWNRQWCHHLDQDDVDALVAANRLWDFTRTLEAGNGWRDLDPCPEVTAAEVNAWSLAGFGHDSLNCWIVVKAKCVRGGQPTVCAVCNGDGSTERYAGQKAAAEAWEATPPPVGDGWQMWETTSEGSPVSPVFATAEELAQWLHTAKDYDIDTARKFVESGWGPTFSHIGGVFRDAVETGAM